MEEKVLVLGKRGFLKLKEELELENKEKIESKMSSYIGNVIRKAKICKIKVLEGLEENEDGQGEFTQKALMFKVEAMIENQGRINFIIEC